MALLHEETNEEQGVREAMMAVGDSGSCIQLLAPALARVDDREVPRPQRPGHAADRLPRDRHRRRVRHPPRARAAPALRRPQARHERQPRQLHPPEGCRRRPRRARGASGQLRRTDAGPPGRPGQQPRAGSAQPEVCRPERQAFEPTDPTSAPRPRPRAVAATSVTLPAANPLVTTHDGTRHGSAAASRPSRAPPGAAGRRRVPRRGHAARAAGRRERVRLRQSTVRRPPRARLLRCGSTPPADSGAAARRRAPGAGRRRRRPRRARRARASTPRRSSRRVPGAHVSWPSELIVSSRRL